MELIDRLLSGGFVGALALMLLLLVCAGGYLTMKRGRADLVDSPWFWSFVFSTVGLLGVWAISGKYDDRQKRVEARYEARQRIAEQRAQGDSAPRAAHESDPPQKRLADDKGASQVGYSSERRVPLRFLAGGLLFVSIISGFILWRKQRTESQKHTSPS